MSKPSVFVVITSQMSQIFDIITDQSRFIKIDILTIWYHVLVVFRLAIFYLDSNES